MRVRKGYADSRHGQLHHICAGEGRPVLLLHQTPRSIAEYHDVLPIIAATHRAVAMDTLGFGASARTDLPMSIELFADAVQDLIAALELRDVVLVGHHTGGVIATEVAARHDPAVTALVLSGTPYVDGPRRERVSTAPPIDHVESQEDGSHLARLWSRRKDFYPAGSTTLLNRFVVDALAVVDRVEEGHRAVNRYRMEDRIGLVAVPTLVLCGELDSYSLPDVPRLRDRLADAQVHILAGTGVPAPDDAPEAFARAVTEFADRVER